MLNLNFTLIRRNDGLVNLMKENGQVLSDEWFLKVYDFKDGVARVQNQQGEYNWIDSTGNFVSPYEWFAYASDFKDGKAVVQNKDERWNFIDLAGCLLHPDWKRVFKLSFYETIYIKSQTGISMKLDWNGNVI